jgi:hypothetical protein
MAFEEHVVSTPQWIVTLMDEVVVDCVRPMGFIGHLGYRFWSPDDPTNPSTSWVVVAYPTANEVRGQNRLDGAMFVSGFSLDVGRLLASLTPVAEVVWNMPAKYNNSLDGPELSVRGQFAGKHVWLRFFHLPPPDESPAFAVDPLTSEATELPA